MTSKVNRRRKSRQSLTIMWSWQAGLCFYCDRETWLPQSDTDMQTLSIETTNAMATREHLVRLADGGVNGGDNLVMACFECNSARGEVSWELYLDNKEHLARMNCRDPEAGYGLTILPDGPTFDFIPKPVQYAPIRCKKKRRERAVWR